MIQGGNLPEARSGTRSKQDLLQLFGLTDSKSSQGRRTKRSYVTPSSDIITSIKRVMPTNQLLRYLFLFIFVWHRVESKVWNANELVVGEWKVELRGGWFFDPYKIFPRTSTRCNSKLLTQRRPWGSNLECNLSICPDGTFVMMPSIGAKNFPKNYRLPLRGEWNVLGNPYCITDRFYDQLQLRSYPRAATSKRRGETINSGSLEISCRVWGRFAKSNEIGRKGNMSHGALVWKADQSLKFPRRILASFKAKRCANDPRIDGWEDQEYFGY